ncbi:C40 family peptidase [Acrocarpospora macrocephala]|uniref:NlpC/P60 domain-containing protein n=1 Tax=Acrocarpospora macrocephala TaxID=150177 RepID=A0A5M3X5N1_9ACTN|nr:hypothetical protein Amac_099880 [Acrocarpospora macrocephala]
MTVGLLLLALLVAQGGATAEPRPTIAQARAKLVKLNEQADEVVEKYNQATESYQKARKKYQGLNTALERKRARLDALREGLVSLAVGSYQFGGLSGMQGFLDSGNADAMLSRMTSIDQMARTQTEALRSFEATTVELRAQRDEAKVVLAEADTERDKVGKEKKKADRLVREQTKLLRQLGAFNVGDPNSTGIAYTGPASGDARVALEFAFAQVGKPYRYGATGPGSYDCSGFSQASWRAAGVQLPRTTYEQWAWGAGRRVPLDALQPGDLLFSRGLGHMGIYAGDGKMVHSPQTGDVVKVVTIDGYWRGRFLGAVRP